MAAKKKKPTWKVPLAIPYALGPSPDDRDKHLYTWFTTQYPVGSVVTSHYHTTHQGVEDVEPFEFHATLKWVTGRYGDKGCTGAILQDVSGARFPISISDLFAVLNDRGCGPDMMISGKWGFKKHGQSVTIRSLDLKE